MAGADAPGRPPEDDAGGAAHGGPGVPPDTPPFAWYGDDFTGATDTLMNASQCGLRALLFLGVPSPAQLAAAGPLDALGIAGTSRSMAPAPMRAELSRVAAFLATLDAPVWHYKVCSTFDSAPHVGSIGTAITTLRAHRANPFVPVVGGQPNLGRYCLFGHLFASAGAGGDVVRIDRHPTMSRHPVTPMRESDLRVHLGLQGLGTVASVPFTAYAQGEAALHERLASIAAGAPDAVLMDVSREDELAAIGAAIWRQALRAPLLAVGPSSVVRALAAAWPFARAEQRDEGAAARDTSAGASSAAPAGDRADAHEGAAPRRAVRRDPGAPVFVVSGSLSPVTARQIGEARSYEKQPLDAARLAGGDAATLDAAAARAIASLRAGRHVLAHTSRVDAPAPSAGVDDPVALARGCGRLLKAVLGAFPVSRAGVAGGDTSSHALDALEAWALGYAGELSPGVALCRLRADAPELDGLEIILKGGQMGRPDVFEALLRGR